MPITSFSRKAGTVIASVAAHGVAEVAVQGVPDIGEVLHPERPVEAPGGAECLDGFGRRIGRQDHHRRIARQVQDKEGEGDDEEDRQDGAQQAADEITQHQAICSAR
jgi:hypothetical protein